jgi:eukaryotic-like serine/threonine-protein kinase
MSLDVTPYRIDRKLAEGGMGEVYAAHHTVLGRKVALKVLHSHVAAHPESLARFRQEAQVLAQLEHPHAVRIYDFVADASRPYLVMELVEGESLATHLEQHGPLPFESVAIIARQVLEVLEVAHTQGVVHRDLKPANLMLDASQPGVFVRVVDFGIALLQTAVPSARLTADGQAPGTAAYMSPEQVNGEPLDARSDLYALACVLFELVSGRRVFESGAVANVLSAHLFREPPMLDEVSAAKVPEAWQAVLRQALSKPREARFPTAKAMRLAFDEALAADPRGGAERGPSVESRHQFVAAQVDDAPVVLEVAGATEAVVRTLEEALAGVGVSLTTDLAKAGAVVVAAATGPQAVEVARGLAGQHLVLVCAPDEWMLVTTALQAGVFDFIPLPLEGADVARRVVRALRAFHARTPQSAIKSPRPSSPPGSLKARA